MSNINYLSINENFPVPGEDNDTQVFRDNFDTIKTSLRLAKEEITDLQDNSARTDLDNDFNRKIISRAVFQDTYERKIDLGNIDAETDTLFIDYENGSYQVVEVSGGTKNVDFLNFPSDSTVPASVGKVTIEIYGGGALITAGSFVSGKVYTIDGVGSTDFTSIGASDNNVGTTFTATGSGAGTGTAKEHVILTFIPGGGTVLKKSTDFPDPLTVNSPNSGTAGNPIIIEVWQHSSDRIFLNYVGQFKTPE